MKLSKLYCNKPFKDIVFNTKNGGVNVILANTKVKSNKNDTHGLGKTKLIELIDFLLLKGVDKKSRFFLTGQKKVAGNSQPISKEDLSKIITFTQKDEKDLLFADYEFYLEILLNSGKYLTIKRTVNTPTKINFKLSEKVSANFIFYNNWDYENIAFDKARKMLNDWFSFDFYKKTGYDYRKSKNYSLRLQGDYQKTTTQEGIFQLSKFAKGKDIDWKPFMFDLLGFDGKVLKEKYKLEEEIKKQKNIITIQEKDSGVKATEKDSIVGQIDIKQQEKDELEQELEDFNFYRQDKEVIRTLVEKLENKIASLNTQLYNVEYDIQKLDRSIKNEFSFDIDKVKSLFSEVELHFPDQLSKSYEQLITFNKKITEERNAQIKESLKEKSKEQKSLQLELIELNQQRKKYRDVLHDTTIFKKYKEYQKKLIKVESDMIHLQAQLNALDNIKNKRKEIEKIVENDLNQTIKALKNIIDNTSANKQYSTIRRTFAELVKQITHHSAYIAVTPNKNYNFDFECKFDNSAKDEGNSYYKLLCVAFDLAILINYSTESYFRFVFHDDVFANLDNRRRMSLLEVIRNTTIQYDTQYLFSIIKHDAPPNEDFSFNPEEIILELHDNDNSGKLFLMDY